MKIKTVIFIIGGGLAGVLVFISSSVLRLWLVGEDPFPLEGVVVPVLMGGADHDQGASGDNLKTGNRTSRKVVYFPFLL